MRKVAIILAVILRFAGCSESLPLYESELRPVLIQGAMKVETDILISALAESHDYTIGHWRYVAGKIGGYPVVVSVTRCGVMNASASTALAIETFKPCAVINQGTAGGHDPALHIRDIVIASDCFNASAWKALKSAKGKGVDYRNINLIDVNFYDEYENGEEITFLPSDGKLKASALAVKDKYTAGKIIEGRMASYDTWENRVDNILFFHEKFGSSCEEMETFPAAKVCRIYGVPFLGVRIISNSAPNGEEYIPETGHECQAFVIEIVKDYVKEMNK
ncbi:MAG: 5'-methylthioadenosine/S-adenosylhomocysteine nucleosidase [Synergistaceae bacterium]|nr:5'-methylthioadenosine/S-adenosylhomocysteine nucleosidase [Synergistaceae bacterium]